MTFRPVVADAAYISFPTILCSGGTRQSSRSIGVFVATFGMADRIAPDPDWEGPFLGSLRTNRYRVHTMFADDVSTAALTGVYPAVHMRPWP